MPRTTRILRWLLLLPAAAAAGWVIYVAAGQLIQILDLAPPHWAWILIKLYAYLFIGFLFTAVGTKMAPNHKNGVTYGLLFVCVAVGAWVMFTCPDGVAVGITLGLAIVAGGSGYAIRIRGFGPTRKYV